jgi:solute carrier family 25 (mitochondrial folate transporter), member 32
MYTGVIDCFRKMYKIEGVGAFYKGLTPLAIKIFPSSGVFFLAYEYTLLMLNSNRDEGPE